MDKYINHLSFMVCLASALLFCGCAFVKLDKDLAEFEKTYALRGKITNLSPLQKNVLVVFYEKEEDRLNISHATLLNASSKHYTMAVKQGTYYIIAFEDSNNDLTWDSDEPVGYYGKPDAVEISKEVHDAETPRARMGLDITISPSNRFPAGFSTDITLTPDIVKNSLFEMAEVVSLDDERFAQGNGKKGYWEPLTFLKEIGAGIYFTEAYDPDKIPILFVHGALGSPSGWKEMVNRIDRDRFQPWFYYYPSGLPLDKLGNALNILVMDLKRQFEFDELYVVAQSMGGLVARSFILKNYYTSQQDFIQLFISISTPWNGHRMTAAGVKRAPVAVPSWHDMVPESTFIKNLFQNNLPQHLRYYLFFSYKGDCSMFLENNDGTVELSSELDLRAQSEATRLFGYNEDHGSIIYSEAFLAQIIKVLDGH